MTPREVLRSHLGINNESANPNEPEANDEEILNVLRCEKEKDQGKNELTTGEIADQLPIGSKQTHNRLVELEEEDRVEKRRAGRTDMWRLAPEEPERVMNPNLGSIVEQSSRARRKASSVKKSGVGLCMGGFVLLIIGMTLLISELSFPFLPVAGFLAFGYAFGVVGAFVVMSGIVLHLAGIAAPQLAERLLLD